MYTTTYIYIYRYDIPNLTCYIRFHIFSLVPAGFLRSTDPYHQGAWWEHTGVVCWDPKMAIFMGQHTQNSLQIDVA